MYRVYCVIHACNLSASIARKLFCILLHRMPQFASYARFLALSACIPIQHVEIGKFMFPAARPTQPVVVDPCNPSPCGINAECTAKHGDDDDYAVATCKCRPGFPKGDAYTACRPECVNNADCPQKQACGSQKCIDPCPGLCGHNAVCRVINHNPLCTCNDGYSGSPYQGCRQIPRKKYQPMQFNS